eukprot:TRINITY_DN5997_c0_g1_i1.p1 TRINITY_DN5997_c0_g1~~TRINITY_DN5997_c0_g1_i1.p1  ORF type:complete len:131 (-),score=19.51 TRINITY_DN5997_c0_g1_i1:220-612(-)
MILQEGYFVDGMFIFPGDGMLLEEPPKLKDQKSKLQRRQSESRRSRPSSSSTRKSSSNKDTRASPSPKANCYGSAKFLKTPEPSSLPLPSFGVEDSFPSGPRSASSLSESSQSSDDLDDASDKLKALLRI